MEKSCKNMDVYYILNISEYSISMNNSDLQIHKEVTPSADLTIQEKYPIFEGKEIFSE